VEIPPEQRFHFRDGSDVSDLAGLKEKIESLSYEEFYNHVNEEKNDFANWIGSVLQQPELAGRLKKVTSIVETVELLNEALYPEETKRHEGELQAQDVPDTQERIEEELFAPEPFGEADGESADAPTGDVTSAPTGDFTGEIPEISAVPPPTAAEAEREDAEEDTAEAQAGDEQTEEGEEVSLPPPEEVDPAKLPGAPVTTREPAHAPLTERMDRPVTAEEHMRFLTRESLYGVILGIIIGFILGVVVALYA